MLKLLEEGRLPDHVDPASLGLDKGKRSQNVDDERHDDDLAELVTAEPKATDKKKGSGQRSGYVSESDSNSSISLPVSTGDKDEDNSQPFRSSSENDSVSIASDFDAQL